MKTIKIIPYGCLLHFTTDFNEWKEVYELLSPHKAEESYQGLTYDHEDGNFYVGVFNGRISVLVHELAHVCLMVASRVGMEDVTKDQEQFCYLIDHLTTEVLKKFPDIRGV